MRGIYYVSEDAIGNYNPRRTMEGADYASIFGWLTADGDIAVESIYGPLDEGYWDRCFNDYITIASKIEQHAKNGAIKAIVLAIDSPGGAVNGLFSLTDYIRKVSSEKPIYAYIHGSGAFSAAYAIAAACSRVYIARDSETGACGAYGRAMEMDADFMKKEYGILQRVFRSANAPKKNLSIVSNEEAAKEFQAAIDKAGDEYIAAVSSFRSIAKDKAEEEFGKGGTVDAGYALEHGMVDKIATIEELYEDISSRAEENAEGRGEDMEVNVNALSSEERARIFNEITALEPSLLASAIDEARKNAAANERSRIAALNALQVAGNAEIDALIKSAIEDGRSACEIGLECFEIMKKASSEGKGAAAGKAEAILGVLADDTAAVDVPQGEESVDALIDKALGNKEE